MEDVLECLIDYATVGTIGRLTGVSKSLYRRVHADNMISYSVAKNKLKWKRHRISFKSVICAITNTKSRCHECGSDRGISSISSRGRMVRVCNRCVSQKNSYREQLDRTQVHQLNSRISPWRRSKTSVDKMLRTQCTVARRRPLFEGLAHMYWAHNVMKHIRYLK